MHLLNVCHTYHENHFYICIMIHTYSYKLGEPSQCDGFGGQVLQKVGQTSGGNEICSLKLSIPLSERFRILNKPSDSNIFAIFAYGKQQVYTYITWWWCILPTTAFGIFFNHNPPLPQPKTKKPAMISPWSKSDGTPSRSDGWSLRFGVRFGFGGLDLGLGPRFWPGSFGRPSICSGCEAGSWKLLSFMSWEP